jgi:hypothetical protein
MNMEKLSVEEYNTLEREALADISNFAIEAFAPAGFQSTNYPDRIYSERELWRYLDVMQENSYASNLLSLDNGLSQFEFDTAKKVILRIKEFCKTISDNISYKSGLSKQLYIFRYINNLFPNKKLTLFELGPGSGFLTALLAAAGHRVYCLDNSQAFYIYQNHFFQHFGINELARKDERNFGEEPITHIPWWLWVNDDFELPKVDVFVGNAVLNEMKSNALRYTLNKINKSINNDGFMIFQQSGEGIVSKYEDTMRTLYEYGWFLCNSKGMLVWKKHDLKKTIKLKIPKIDYRQYKIWINLVKYYLGKAPYYVFPNLEIDSEITNDCTKTYHDISINKIHELFENKEGVDTRTKDEKFCETVGSFDIKRFSDKEKMKKEKRFRIKLKV